MVKNWLLRIGLKKPLASGSPFAIQSLGMLVPNSRVWHEKEWQPNIMHYKTHLTIHFVSEHRLKCTLTLLIPLHWYQKVKIQIAIPVDNLKISKSVVC